MGDLSVPPYRFENANVVSGHGAERQWLWIGWYLSNVDFFGAVCKM